MLFPGRTSTGIKRPEVLRPASCVDPGGGVASRFPLATEKPKIFQGLYKECHGM